MKNSADAITLTFHGKISQNNIISKRIFCIQKSSAQPKFAEHTIFWNKVLFYLLYCFGKFFREKWDLLHVQNFS